MVQDSGMPVMPVELVVAAYEWVLGGRCFKCARAGVHTAAVGHLPIGAGEAIWACATCTLLMERDRELAAARYGWPYQPGTPEPARR